MEALLFFGVGGLALLFAVLMLSTENAVHSALCLIANFGCVAFIFLMLDAPFLSMVQIAVYAGAIMVLFLFVIMLLRAEQSSDTTTRKFPRLWLLATILAGVFLVTLALPITLGGFKLPELANTGSPVRFVNASAVGSTTFTVSGSTLTEPIVSAPVAQGDATRFETLPAGTYSVAMRDAGNNQPISLPQSITLDGENALTLVATGEVNQDTSSLVTLASLPTDVSEVGSNDGRLVVYNGLAKEFEKNADGTLTEREIEHPVSLVDLGPEAAVTTVVRDGQTVLIDRIIAPTVQRQGEPVVVTYPRGTYNLALLDPAFNIIERLDEYEVVADTETDILYLPAGSGAEGGVVESFTIDTQPSFGSPKGIGRMLFTGYLLPVNLVGMLLLVALVGVIVLSRPEAEKSERRNNVRRKVSRPLVNVISTQTGSDVSADAPQLPTGDS
jgi:NADH-quinone oxidoreductase subunit J